AFAPDGKTLVLGGHEGSRGPTKTTLSLWDVASGDEVRRFDGPAHSGEPPQRYEKVKWFDGLCFAPDGRSLALVADHQVLLWELATGKERCLLGVLPRSFRRKKDHRDGASSLTFSPDGRTLAVGCGDGAVRWWDVSGGRELPPLVGHQGGVRAVAYAPDGRTLWSFGWDNKVLTWPVDGPFREWQPRRDALPRKSLEALWNNLRSDD